MPYRVEIEKRAAKTLESIDDPDYSRLKAAILNWGKNPRPHGYRKLKGREAYRITVGNYRIIYEIKDNKLYVIVLLVGHRKDIYRKI